MKRNSMPIPTALSQLLSLSWTAQPAQRLAAVSTTSMNLLVLGITQPPINSKGAVPPRVKASRQQTENPTTRKVLHRHSHT